MLKKLISLSLIAVLFAAFISISTAEEGFDGKAAFEANKCNLCHSIESQGIEAKKKSDKYPDLSKLAEVKDAELYIKYMKKEAKINDKNHPIPYKGTDEDLTKLVDWIIGLNAK